MSSYVFLGGRRAQGFGVPAAFGFLTGLLVGCSSPQLVPVSPMSGGTARAESEGIAVEAEPAARDEPSYLPADIEPLKVTIRNDSGRGIHIDLEAIELVGPSQTLATVSPLAIEPLPPITGLGLDPASPLTQAGPVGVDLRLQGSYFGPQRPFEYGPQRLAARQAEIAAKAFDGGYIDSGDTQVGFLYFKAPYSAGERLTLVIPVRTGQGSGALTTLTLAFVVEG